MQLARRVYTTEKSWAAGSHGAQASHSVLSVTLNMLDQCCQSGVCSRWFNHRDLQPYGLLLHIGQPCML